MLSEEKDWELEDVDEESQRESREPDGESDIHGEIESSFISRHYSRLLMLSS